ncbi:MAG TPA: hypothetical protein VMV79_08590 [Alphaproteobacteria bacterium]|nr:hypothetical protein [Alphaproteobacteria bacterium]
MQHIALGRAAAVSADQVTALGALVAYVARARRTSEFRVERELADRFGVANVTCLPGSSFDDAIRYLADQAPAPAAA